MRIGFFIMLCSFVLSSFSDYKKREHYVDFYEDFFEQNNDFGNKKVFYFQSNPKLVYPTEFNDFGKVSIYIADSLEINEELLKKDYEEWFIERYPQFEKIGPKGVSEKKKRNLLKNKKESSVVVYIAPPFELKKSIFLLQYYKYCDGLCDAKYAYVVKKNELNQINTLFGGAIVIQ